MKICKFYSTDESILSCFSDIYFLINDIQNLGQIKSMHSKIHT